MKRRISSNLLVKRISSSPYFSPSFFKLEKNKIENESNAQMLPFNSEIMADILITNTHTDLSQISHDQLNACKLMIHPNSGYDNFKAKFVKEANFPIVIGNPIRAHAVVDYILSALYTHYSPIPSVAVWSEKRQWPRKLLKELNILILGQGHIGSILKTCLSGQSASLIFFDPYLEATDLNLKNVDVVILACSLNELNYQIINKEFLLQLNDNFLLINSARGGLVKTSDLLEVLTKKSDSYAILDVFENEPADFSIFSSLQNILVSSHIAGVYQQIDTTTIEFEATIINDFIQLSKTKYEKKYSKMILKNRLFQDDFLI